MIKKILCLLFLLLLISPTFATWVFPECEAKRNIEIVSTDYQLDLNTLLIIDSLNIQDWNINNTDELRIGDENNGIEVPSELSMPDSNNVSFLFALPNAITASTDVNTNYAIYYNCSSGTRTPINGILAWYPFEEGSGTSTADWDTNNSENDADFNATLQSALSWNTTRELGNYALDVNGNYYITQSTLLDIHPQNGTISFWFYLWNDFNSDSNSSMMLINKYNNQAIADNALRIILNSASGKMEAYQIKYDGETTDELLLSVRTHWTGNTWYNVAYSWGTGGSKLIIDGNQDDTGGTTAIMTNGSIKDFYIGARATDNGQIFNGIMDNLIISNYQFTEFYSDLNYPTIVVSSIELEHSGITANFTIESPIPVLDPENNINRVSVYFNDTSSCDSTCFVNDWAWYIDGDLNSTDQNINLGFSAIGDFNITLVADTNIATQNQYSSTITIGELAQDMNFVWMPLFPDEGESTDFNGSTSTDSNITTWTWDFGDGILGSDQNTTHSFTPDGDYNVCLTITRFSDVNNLTCYTLSVAKAVLGLDFTWKPHEINLKTWNLDFNGTSDSTVSTWIWDFNDGSKASGGDVNHLFNNAQDYNVCLTATNPNDVNNTTCHTITTYLLTVFVPLNEKNSVEITPYSLRVESTLQIQDKNGLDVDTNFFLSDTATYRITAADSNGNYFPKNYLVTTVIGTPTYSLQPYLSDEIYTLFYVFDNYAKTPLANVRIQIQRSISNVGIQTISETLTDSTGTASASFVIGGLYTINFYYEDELKYSMTLVPSSTDPIYVYLDLITTTPITPLIYKEITVSWQPDSGSYYVPDTNILDFNQTISILNGTIETIQIVAVNDSNTLYDQNFSSNGGTFSQSFDLNSISVGYPVYYTILIKTTDGNYFFYYTNYTIKPTTVWGTLMSALEDIKNALGENTTGIIAIFVTMIICGGAIAGTPINMKGSSILAGVMLGIFTFIGWLNFYLFALIAFGILALWMWSE